MAIYRLRDILKSKPIYGAGLAAKEFGKYKYFRQSDFGKEPSKFVNSSENKIMKKNDFFISRAGTIDSYIHEKDDEYVYAGYLVKYPINEKIAIPKYVFYWSKGVGKKQILLNSNTGSTMPKLNPPIALTLKINLPNFKIQKQIIDIIEPMKLLILKLKAMINNINFIIMNLPIKETSNKNIFKEIKTGKLNTNVIDKNGRFNFYSCSKNIYKSNYNSFKGRYILLSGNGELYTWWYQGEFDLYQRVYALKERNDFFTTFLSVKRNIYKLKKRSNGAVIKFIKLSDINSINMLNNKYENLLKYLFIFESDVMKLIFKIKCIKNKMIDLMIK